MDELYHVHAKYALECNMICNSMNYYAYIDNSIFSCIIHNQIYTKRNFMQDMKYIHKYITFILTCYNTFKS